MINLRLNLRIMTVNERTVTSLYYEMVRIHCHYITHYFSEFYLFSALLSDYYHGWIFKNKAKTLARLNLHINTSSYVAEIKLDVERAVAEEPYTYVKNSRAVTQCDPSLGSDTGIIVHR